MEKLVQRYGKQAQHMLKEFDLDAGKFIAVLDAKYEAGADG